MSIQMNTAAKKHNVHPSMEKQTVELKVHVKLYIVVSPWSPIETQAKYNVIQ